MALKSFITNSLTTARAPTQRIVDGAPSFNGLRVGPEPAREIQAEISAGQGLNFMSYPTDLPKYYFGMIESETSGVTFGSGFRGLVPKRGYRLPLPLHLQDSHSVQYDHNYNWLNLINNATLNLSQTVFNAAGALGGFAVNNLKQVTIQSPDFRTFSFEWKLSPRNLTDSRDIRILYHSIKRGMLPQGSGFGANNVVFTFPNVYQCFFAPNAEWLYNFKPAVITACQIDYNGGNPQPAFYKGSGAPESIILRLSFLEIDYWVRQDLTLSELPGGRSTFWQGNEEQLRFAEKVALAETLNGDTPAERAIRRGAGLPERKEPLR